MANSNKIFGAFGVKESVNTAARRTHESLVDKTELNAFNVYRTWASVGLSLDINTLTRDDFEEMQIDNSQTQSNAQSSDNTTTANQQSKAYQEYDSKGSALYGDDGPKMKLKDNKKRGTKTPSTGVRALFNKFHAVPIENDAFAWRLSQNMPLIDSPAQRRLQRSLSSCSVKDLVNKSRMGLMGACVYDYSDFMFCKYLGKVPNNYMITLRRYNIPVADYVKPYGNATAQNGYTMTHGTGDNAATSVASTRTNNGGIPLGCMVTWMGTPGNDMSEILKYSFSMPFKKADSKWETVQNQQPSPVNNSSKGFIGSQFASLAQSSVFKALANNVVAGTFNPRGGQTDHYPGPHYDPQKAYTGVDMIKSIYIRDPDAGLQFEHKFKLTFDYELKSYDGVNGKQAMLDLLGNILTVCYTTGDFWPGGYRHEGGSSAMQPMSSLECMQHHKTFTGYLSAVKKDFAKIKAGLSSIFSGGIGNIINNLKKVADDMMGAFLGGDPETVPPVYAQGTNALLSDAAVGLWHVTVGNPNSPIISEGNMILTNCSVEHYGPLGIDDFPTGLRVVCELTEGKPRDKRLIERIYNSGNDRIYMPLDQDIFNMLRKSHQLNQSIAQGKGRICNKGNKGTKPDDVKAMAKKTSEAAKATRTQLAGMIEYPVPEIDMEPLEQLDDANTIERVFGKISGTGLIYGIVNASGEMNEGAPAFSDRTNVAKAMLMGDASKVAEAEAEADKKADAYKKALDDYNTAMYNKQQEQAAAEANR